jgi:hypothetical protein
MLNKSILTLLAVATASIALNAKADSLYDWSFVTTAGAVDGSGTLTVDTSSAIVVDGNTGYAVTSFSGTYLGQSIDGLSPVGTFYADNLLAALTPGTEQLDGDGITFAFGPSQTLENFWVPDSGDPEYAGPYGQGSDRETVGLNNGTFIATPVAVPEPANALALLGTAGASLVFAARQRK